MFCPLSKKKNKYLFSEMKRAFKYGNNMLPWDMIVCDNEKDRTILQVRYNLPPSDMLIQEQLTNFIVVGEFNILLNTIRWFFQWSPSISISRKLSG
jgi:hypothetical protein